MAKTHEAAVQQVSSAVKAFYSRREPFRIFHGSTNSTRPTRSHHASDPGVVDISHLSDILEIDKPSQTAVVEPNVPMDKLVQATLAHGLIPPVVMEFPGITVGGGFSGSAGESSSFRYGYFSETVRSIEMVLATGDVVTASSVDNPDLFHGAAGTAGTLGITTKLEVGLVPAKRFVRLEYRGYGSVGDTVAAVRRATGDDAENDFVDGILYSTDLGLVMVGRLTDELPPAHAGEVQSFSGAWDPWFYLHAESKAKKSQRGQVPVVVDYIPLPEYLFRYDRGGFWVGALAFRYFPLVPFNRYTRWFLNDFMHTRMLYRALQGSSSEMSFGTMVQDLSLPYDTAEEFIDYTAQDLSIWPLWLCPLRATSRPTFHPTSTSTSSPANGTTPGPQPMLNIGLWGTAAGAARDIDTFVRQNRALEARLTELGGRKVLYSHTYYTESEFWALYDREWYDDLRERYQAGSLPSIYDKVHVDVDGIARQQATQLDSNRGKWWWWWGVGRWAHRLSSIWPLPGFLGIYRAIQSRDYLIHRKPSWTYWRMGGADEREEEGTKSKKL